MLATEYWSVISPPTTTVPIAISAHIDPPTQDFIAGSQALFIADNTSVERIKKVIAHCIGVDGCDFQVYYFKQTPYKFFVKATMNYLPITDSALVSMFAEKESDIVITPLAENYVSANPAAIDSEHRDRLRLVMSHGGGPEATKVLYIYRGEIERIAS